MNVATAELDLANSGGNGTYVPPSRGTLGSSAEVSRPAANLWAVRTGVPWRSEHLRGPLTRSGTLRLGLRPAVSGANDVISVSSGGPTTLDNRMHLVDLFDTGDEAGDASRPASPERQSPRAHANAGDAGAPGVRTNRDNHDRRGLPNSRTAMFRGGRVSPAVSGYPRFRDGSVYTPPGASVLQDGDMRYGTRSPPIEFHGQPRHSGAFLLRDSLHLATTGLPGAGTTEFRTNANGNDDATPSTRTLPEVWCWQCGRYGHSDRHCPGLSTVGAVATMTREPLACESPPGGSVIGSEPEMRTAINGNLNGVAASGTQENLFRQSSTGDAEVRFLGWVEYNAQALLRYPHCPTVRYFGTVAGFKPGRLDELPHIEVGHQGPLAWILSVHTVQQLMLEELHGYKPEFQDLCKEGHNREVVTYLACLKARFCKLVAPIDLATFNLVWDSLLEIVTGWQDEVLQTERGHPDIPDRSVNRRPERRVMAPPRLRTVGTPPRDTSPGSCVSSPQSVRRAISCNLDPVRRTTSVRSRARSVRPSIVEARPVVPSAGPTLMDRRSSRYLRAPYVGAARDHEERVKRSAPPESSDSSDSEDDGPRVPRKRCQTAVRVGSHVGSVSFKDRIKSFPKFAQPRPDQSWTDYLHGLTRVLRQHCVPASEWAVWLADRLQGKAHSLLVNLEDEQLDSWDCLVSAMNAQFNVTQDSAAARQDLMTRKQGKGETVADFINGLQLLARRAYANNLPKRQEVIMDRLRDGLATPSLRHVFDACEEEAVPLPFLELQHRLIHRESRDEPERYRSQLLNQGTPKDPKPKPSGKPQASGDTVLLCEALKGMQLVQRPAVTSNSPGVPVKPKHELGCWECGDRNHIQRDCPIVKQRGGDGDGCWECGDDNHRRRDCPRVPPEERARLNERFAAWQQEFKSRGSAPGRGRGGGRGATKNPTSGSSTRGQGNL